MSNSSGGIWMFDIEAEALPPEPDDTLTIESNINHCEKVCFRLTNKSRQAAPFTAHITQDSAVDFTVEPTTGTLEPYGKQGTAFYVFFQPTLYQSRFDGCLVIETKDMYWSFRLVGRLPKYRPPNGSSRRVLRAAK